jgi:hypothetical protein
LVTQWQTLCYQTVIFGKTWLLEAKSWYQTMLGITSIKFIFSLISFSVAIMHRLPFIIATNSFELKKQICLKLKEVNVDYIYV